LPLNPTFRKARKVGQPQPRRRKGGPAHHYCLRKKAGRQIPVQPLSQRYTRLAEDTYRYLSNTGFSAEIVLDELGLVVTYPGGWERLATM